MNFLLRAIATRSASPRRWFEALLLVRREYDITQRRDADRLSSVPNVNANGRIPVLQVGDRFIS